ncbi:1-phosphatidylinositol 4,5-bisphosphate phosphodiesterase gamma-1 [Toxocara canis]|uniref:Phosphoinositide phospholipase C n=1 Tax=Toxocara canis TaxID=6265 RepID=A0A0B2V2H2_TOXCA|nr:1-phosphatidylinositol 4,5-bisphosphate phosphodiesterase gamma-1 [Toxocara canis]
MWPSEWANSRKVSGLHSTGHSPYNKRSLPRHHEIDLEKTFHAMEIGHRVCKLMLLKRWDPTYKKLSYNRETRQLMLSKMDATGKCGKAHTLDLRIVKEVHTLDFKLNNVKIMDKWAKDKEIKQFDISKILVLAYGTEFILNYWILLFDAWDACRMWCQGIHHLMMDTVSASHTLVVERWLRKEFYNLVDPNSQRVAMKHMKPFVQTSLQFKVQSKQLQEITEEEMNFDAFATAYQKLVHLHSEEMNFDAFATAYQKLVHLHSLFSDRFSAYSDDAIKVSFSNFLRFLKDVQNDEMGSHRERASDLLRRYLRELDASRDIPEPSLSVPEFCDFLFSRENNVWDSINERVIHDMNRPLSHYWIASSHNTYLTGDQLKSESSLDAYARALLMGCRCIECELNFSKVDCWDGQKRGQGDFLEIVIYHGYTMTSKLNLRDVLHTIRHYAFINSEFPVILSIEDNCSVPAQRLLAQEVKDILGDLLLTAPVSREETALPSPAALKRKIILKHKKLPIESEDIVPQQNEDDDQDLLSKECVKRGILYLKSNTTHEWTKHVFVLFSDRLCYMLDQCEGDSTENLLQRDDSVGTLGDDDSMTEDTTSLAGFGVRLEELHVTEEWFHGKTDRDTARDRLLEHKDKGNGLFLVRDSTIFIGDFSLSFLHDERVHHCRIRTRMVNGEKKYYFLETKQMDTLYELISYYTKEKLKTPTFSTTLVTPCPQPCPHLNMPWFSEQADKARAEELLNTVREDGAFLIRYSGTDKNVFVLSLRVDGEFWHYRLKRDGRIFVVNQTVFENLNQIVDFYSTHDFVRGICLKYPVNERNVGKYMSADFSSAVAPGCYMELKDLEKDKEVLVRAIEPYTGSQQNEISFPVNAIITVLRKDGNRWRGKYGAHVGFFPARCVTEIESGDSCSACIEDAYLVARSFAKVEACAVQGDGALLQSDAVSYATIELAGSLIAKVPYEETDRPFAFKISQAAAHWNVTEFVMAANSSDDREDWLNTLHELTRTATDRIHILRTREKNLRIASELSNLVVYCQAVPFNPQFATQGSFYEMCSFSETKHEKLMERGLVQFNTRQLSRVYPQASRVTSTNYDPVPMWNSACHMVALNYQTGDRAMQLNQGKFMANGQCGYVLKPAYMIDEMFSPDEANIISTSCPIVLNIQEFVMAANSSDDREDWLNTLHELTRTATDRIHILRTREKNLRIASELSNLVVYCQAVPFNPQFATQGSFYEMCSFSETKHEKLMERGLVQFNTRQLSRVYPQASRVTSTNYDPVPMWNSACHMVALNYQTGDRAMQLNQGKFMANGQCGYVLKPAYMIDEMFSPDEANIISTSCPIVLNIQVIAGRHLSRKDKNKGICSPFVEVEIIGLPLDSASVRTRAIAQGSFYEMCSFSETKHEKLMERGLVQFNTRQLSRVYPQASRVTSTNYDPVPMWNSACHMVALNYQTGDRAMQLNQGKFMANGQCGYVLKPAYMIDEMFSPDEANIISTSCPIVLNIQVIAGRHLSRKDKNKGICSPFVEVEIIGLPLDSASVRTRAIASNGLNPVWNESFCFNIHCPELALLRFYVEDGDFVGPKTDPFIGQAVYPLDCIRTGFRSVALRNQYSEELELSALLVHIDMRRATADGELINPHSALQAGRTVMASTHKKSAHSSGVFSARLNSSDHNSFCLSAVHHTVSTPNSPDGSDGIPPVPTAATRKTSALRKIFRFGKN